MKKTDNDIDRLYLDYFNRNFLDYYKKINIDYIFYFFVFGLYLILIIVCIIAIQSSIENSLETNINGLLLQEYEKYNDYQKLCSNQECIDYFEIKKEEIVYLSLNNKYVKG